MKPRGQSLLGVVVAGLVVGGSVLTARVGPREPDPPPPVATVSQAWACPHGGGKGWTGAVWIANTGSDAAVARVTPQGTQAPAEPFELEVPAGSAVQHEVPAGERAASTMVETFGGDTAVGWVVRAGEQESGVGAEPCLPARAGSWFTAAPTTREGDDAFLVIQNPYDGDAVLDVSLFTADRPPIRASDWTDYVLGARRSVALPLGSKAPAAEVLAAQVDVRLGRVAVSTLEVSEQGGVRSALAQTAVGVARVLPTAGGAGQSELLVAVPGEHQARLRATLLSQGPPEPAGGITEVEQAATSVKAYPVITTGPGSVDVIATAGDGLVTALRTVGRRGDDGATGGAADPAADWVVLPDAAGPRASLSTVVLVNPGSEEARVTLTLLPPSGGEPRTVTVSVPAASVAPAPPDLLAGHPLGAVLVRCSTGTVVALGASAGTGESGPSYALGLGVPVAT